MEERLITFETAKLAKEKGLIISTRCGYFGDFGDLDGDTYPFLGTYSFYRDFKCYNNEDHQIATPSQSLLQKWLLEEHGYFVNVELAYNEWGRFSAGIYKKSKDGRTGIVAIDGISIFDNLEDALEHGLYETLKLINEKTT